MILICHTLYCTSVHTWWYWHWPSFLCIQRHRHTPAIPSPPLLCLRTAQPTHNLQSSFLSEFRHRGHHMNPEKGRKIYTEKQHVRVFAIYRIFTSGIESQTCQRASLLIIRNSPYAMDSQEGEGLCIPGRRMGWRACRKSCNPPILWPWCTVISEAGFLNIG